ncbi:hypothetical protein [Sporosarcina koreensis]|uniref:hypothetical protein n=1 Tax=Sporosarcina koreensis TaxID=334735 RepID=UPI0005911AAD|nr:hypothetical protein [Sporosarcina koreensis]
MKVFLITFAAVYLILSLPAFLTAGYVIDWIPEAGLWQKVGAYTAEGLAAGAIWKTAVAGLAALLLSSRSWKRRTVR